MENKREEKQSAQSAEKWRPNDDVILEMEGRSPWAPTAINSADPRVIVEREFTKRQAENIFESHVPDFVSPELLDFMQLIHYSREANRSSKNQANFVNPLYDPSLIADPLLHDMVERMSLGHAQAGDVMTVVAALGISSGVAAKLTHLFGYRLGYQHDMRHEVREAIRSHEGEVYTPPRVTFEILNPDTGVTNKDRLSLGLVMARRLELGVVGDVKVFERSSFIVRTDEESGIDQKLAASLNNIDLNSYSKIVDGQPIWKRMMMKTKGFESEIRRLLDVEDFESILPMSSTVVVHNPDARKRLEEKRKERMADDPDMLKQAREQATGVKLSRVALSFGFNGRV